MQSSTRYLYGPYYLDRSQLVQKERVDFEVTNGLVSGDRKAPNPISFTKYTRGGITTGETRRAYENGVGWSVKTNTGLTSELLEIGNAQSASVFEALTDDCWTEIFDNLRGGNQVIVDAFESRQTLKMLRNILDLRRFTREFLTEFVGVNRKHSPSARFKSRRAQYLSDKWLEYRYGWTPLIYSVYDALDTLSKRQLARVITVKSRKKSRAVIVDTGTRSQGSPAIDTSWESVRNLSHRVQVQADFRLPAGGNVYDWTSLNPASIAWELLPMSYVWDWLVNVGQVLSNFENYWLFKGKLLTGFETQTFREVKSFKESGAKAYNLGYLEVGDGLVPFQGTWYRSQSWYGRSMCSTKRRAPYSALPLRSNLRIEVNLSSKRILDAVFLSRLQLRKMFGPIVR